MLFENMLIDTPYPLTEIEDRTPKPGHAEESQCTYCKAQGRMNWNPVEEVNVVRSWKAGSKYTPEKSGVDSGGWYSWRCALHPYKGTTSLYADNAPEHLRPKYTQHCEKRELGKRCGQDAVGIYKDQWLCEHHARPIVLQLKQDELMRDDETGSVTR